MRYQDPYLAELLAAEYVLGTLRGRARQRFENLLLAHPSLRGPVREWELKLNRLAGQAHPVKPPAVVWRKLQRRLFAAPTRSRWFDRLALWRGLAFGSSVLAGLLAVALLVNPVQNMSTQLVVISDMKSHQPMWVANASADMGRFYFTSLKTMDMPKDIHCLLWLKPEGSQQVYPLGVLPDKGDQRTLTIAKDMRPMFPGHLLVTLETVKDPTTSPLPAKPSSPPVYEGKWMPLPTET